MRRQGWVPPTREKTSGAASTYEPNYDEVQLGIRVEQSPGTLLGEKKCLEEGTGLTKLFAESKILSTGEHSSWKIPGHVPDSE